MMAIGRLGAARTGKQPKQLGTVFAVTRNLALTSWHCVRENRRVRCSWRDAISEATVESWDESLDVAVLRLARLLPDSLDPVNLTADVTSHDAFVAPGAPAVLSQLHIAGVNGLVLLPDAPMPDGSPGIELFCRSAAAGMPLHGLSGAPVLIGNPQQAAGIIRWNPQQTEHPELAAGAIVYAAPARLILQRWPELAPGADIPEVVSRLAQRGTPDAYHDVRTILHVGLGIEEDEIKVIPAPHSDRSSFIAVDKSQVVVAIETDLTHPVRLSVAARELAAAASNRSAQAGEQYAAILTDGAEWHLYQVTREGPQLVDTAGADSRAPGKLLGWLEAVLATGRGIQPTPETIRAKLGSQSPSYKLDVAELTALYQEHRYRPDVRVKRRVWAKLLTTASGTTFADDDSLFIDHTLLVAAAKVIGHAVLDLLTDAAPADEVMSGRLFSEAKITGVIEADFFGWITDVTGGEGFIRRLAQRLARFSWRHVEHDVLKELYESVIKPETRRQLGEYYTPDWLAEAVLAKCVSDPLKRRVLDASCGSGTFIFHAVRSYLNAAERAGITTADAIRGVTKHVTGIDVHPVAVTLARVTYLLAIGTRRLEQRPEFAVPVFLGDSLRWGQEAPLWSYGHSGLSVSTQLEPESFVTGAAAPVLPEYGSQLNFPDQVVADTGRFDALVTRLADLATERHQEDPALGLAPVFRSFGISPADQPVIEQTFRRMCKLHKDGLDHIWGYFVRNLARPAWLSDPANQVDVLVGNPPWLAYRNMTGHQQKSFKLMCVERGLWAGGTAAASQDLSALFLARCVELYLKPGGQFGYIMPWAVLPRPGQGRSRTHARFRTGSYSTKSVAVKVAFTEAWDLHHVRPSFFPVKPCAVFGARQQPEMAAVPLPSAQAAEGQFDTKHATWTEAAPHIVFLSPERATTTPRMSPYASRFTEGATITPRFLYLVNFVSAAGEN